MNIQYVIMACGPIPQAPQNMTGSQNPSKVIPIITLLLITGLVGYLVYSDWKRKQERIQQLKHG